MQQPNQQDTSYIEANNSMLGGLNDGVFDNMNTSTIDMNQVNVSIIAPNEAQDGQVEETNGNEHSMAEQLFSGPNGLIEDVEINRDRYGSISKGFNPTEDILVNEGTPGANSANSPLVGDNFGAIEPVEGLTHAITEVEAHKE